MSSYAQDIYDLDYFKTDDSRNCNSNAADNYGLLNGMSYPRSEYVQQDDIFCDDVNLYTVLTLNIRSIPANVQSLADSILCNIKSKFNIIGLTETRLSPHLASLYQLPGYKMFSNCRNTHGGGVSLYISECINSSIDDDFSKVETYIECLGVQTNIMNKNSLLLCTYRPPSGNLEFFLIVYR